MDTRRVGDWWESFWAAVAPPHCSQLQEQETRRAFYAGVWSFLQEVQHIGEDAVSEAEGCRRLDQIEADCLAFYADVREGRA